MGCLIDQRRSRKNLARIQNKIGRKLVGCKSNLISSVSMHCMKLSNYLYNDVDGMKRNFFWNTNMEERQVRKLYLP